MDTCSDWAQTQEEPTNRDAHARISDGTTDA